MFWTVSSHSNKNSHMLYLAPAKDRFEDISHFQTYCDLSSKLSLHKGSDVRGITT